MLKKPGFDEHQQKLVEEKKAEYLNKHAKSDEESNDEGFSKGAQLCKSVIPKQAF